MSQDVGISLPEIPRDNDYEEYICAFLQAGGLYIEKNIIYREEAEILELDILATDFHSDEVHKDLIEIKSGNWGFSDIFKIKGWLVYLNLPKGSFIVQKQVDRMDYLVRKANELSIGLIDNSDLSKTIEALGGMMSKRPSEADVQTIRYAYLLERKQLKRIKALKRENQAVRCYSHLDDYFFTVNCHSFFAESAIKRINKLFKLYIDHKNISAKIDNELNGGNYDDEVPSISRSTYVDTFYNANDNIFQTSLFVEHHARVTLLKSCIEHLIKKTDGDFSDDIMDQFEYLTLPRNIREALAQIVKEKYFHLYPTFWQWFTYVMGGFILTDIEDREYELISEKTGIPVEEIPNAFDAYNKLFPREEGSWFMTLPRSNIKWHMLFPPSFCGIGANYRRMVYTEEKNYEGLAKLVSGSKTMTDLVKWNNLAYNILKAG